MSSNKSNRLGIVAAAFLAFAFGASPVFATEILEVQVDPEDPPTFLVIYGTDFGTVDAIAGTPLVFLGTQGDVEGPCLPGAADFRVGVPTCQGKA